MRDGDDPPSRIFDPGDLLIDFATAQSNNAGNRY